MRNRLKNLDRPRTFGGFESKILTMLFPLGTREKVVVVFSRRKRRATAG